MSLLPLDLPPTDPRQRLKARGAANAPVGRFEPYLREWVHDGWEIIEEERLVRTEVSVERPRSVITRNTSPDVPFDRSINPYRGCEHGCIYCFARPSHGYLGLSAGLDFETKLVARPEAPVVLERELRRRGNEVAPIAIGTNTDPYQPLEAKMGVMRGLLEVLSAHNHPVTIVTRGAGVLRDLDILADMAARRLVHVGVSVTTLDADLARKMEPRAPAPATRIRMIRELSRAGIPVRVMAAPMIPGLTDHELEAILTEARRAGARAAGMLLLRLPNEVAPLFADWLERHVPLRAERVLGAIADMRNGQLNDPRFTSRMTGEGIEADLLAQRFAVSCRRLGFAQDLGTLDCTRFAPPPKAGDQLSLF
ncbi:PA0069 family radical SAM protein [Sinirhodobacter sp. WL0062]|uniref:PA0069 family radical SAM protein n=1 Tax=Rhodobacter flavimaris TaxID=2907145 RepID=A0ABS8YZ65_9RHOB|nr:PA0069 family radical SAM protein [Sinirhodobacter sp. WL0062]MCE5974560.1 PA0069 family radical SAM protein [Sinirhodobacter sp. WL0062]